VVTDRGSSAAAATVMCDVAYNDLTIVVINVYKRFFLFCCKNAFLTFFYFSNVFFIFENVEQCKNNGNLKHLYTKTEKSKCCP